MARLAERFLPTVKYVPSDYPFDKQATSRRWFPVSGRHTELALYQELADWLPVKPCIAVWAVVALRVQVPYQLEPSI